MRLTRVTLFIIALIIGSGFYLLVRRQLDELEPRTFQATEESMVDAAHIFAAFVETDIKDGNFDPERFRNAFDSTDERNFEAKIYNHLKSTVGMGVYITDIEDFENPVVDWEARGEAPPVGNIVVQINGDRVTAEGLFDDKLTELVVEEVPGMLDATCGNQSVR